MTDSDLSDFYKDYRQSRQSKKAQNREQSAALLKHHGIIFTEHNNGAHLIVEGNNGYIDFWPGTGKWNDRSGTSGFGVRNLIKLINS